MPVPPSFSELMLKSCKKRHFLLELKKWEVLKSEEFMSANSSFSPLCMTQAKAALDRSLLSHWRVIKRTSERKILGSGPKSKKEALLGECESDTCLQINLMTHTKFFSIKFRPFLTVIPWCESLMKIWILIGHKFVLINMYVWGSTVSGVYFKGMSSLDPMKKLSKHHYLLIFGGY